MKKQLLKFINYRGLLLVAALGLLFSFVKPDASNAQNIVKGEVFVYLSATNENDTTGIQTDGCVIKFYKMGSYGQLVWVKTAPVSSDGKFIANVNTTQDLYAFIFPNDEDDNFSPSYYPGYLDFESAETITPIPGDTVEGDWGAVGKEIVERPAGASSNVSGFVKTSIPFTADFIASAYLLDANGNLVTSSPIAADGRYNLSFYGAGNYEVFTSMPGFESQSKYINVSESKRGDFNVNFDLDVYKGENEITTNTVANSFNLAQNYPNPFNPTTNISFTVNTTGIVKLTIYNAQGKEVSKLVNDLVEPGTYDVTFNGQNLASGIYYYTLQVGNNVVTKKMNLIK